METHSLYFIVFFTSSFFLTVLSTNFDRTPENRVVKKGSSVTLYCQATKNNLFWYYKDRGIVAYDGFDSIEPEFGNFGLLQPVAPPGYFNFNIEISDVTVENAGYYQCKLSFPNEESHSAHLIVIDSEISCSDNTEGRTVIENSDVEFYCDVSYRGYYPPTLKWFKEDGNLLSNENVVLTANGDMITESTKLLNNETYNLRSTLTKKLLAENNNIRFTCTMSFGNVPPIDFTTEDIVAVNELVYGGSQQATTNPIQVLYAPRNVQKIPQADVYNPGDKLSCSGEANPAVERVEWKEISSVIGKVIVGELIVTEEMEGLQFYQCTVFNQIAEDEKNASKLFNFTVQIETTAAPTTVPPSKPSTPPKETPDTPGQRKDATSDDSSAVGIIVGVVVGVIVLIAIIIIVICCCMKRNSKKQEKKPRFNPGDVRSPDMHQVTTPQPKLNNSFSHEDVKPDSLYNYGTNPMVTASPISPSAPNNIASDFSICNEPRSRHPVMPPVLDDFTYSYPPSIAPSMSPSYDMTPQSLA